MKLICFIFIVFSACKYSNSLGYSKSIYRSSIPIHNFLINNRNNPKNQVFETFRLNDGKVEESEHLKLRSVNTSNVVDNESSIIEVYEGYDDKADVAVTVGEETYLDSFYRYIHTKSLTKIEKV